MILPMPNGALLAVQQLDSGITYQQVIEQEKKTFHEEVDDGGVPPCVFIHNEGDTFLIVSDGVQPRDILNAALTPFDADWYVVTAEGRAKQVPKEEEPHTFAPGEISMDESLPELLMIAGSERGKQFELWLRSITRIEGKETKFGEWEKMPVSPTDSALILEDW